RPPAPPLFPYTTLFRSVHRSVKPGARTAELLPEVVGEAIAGMPVPKPMRWGDHDYAFARPVHWLVLLLGNEVVPAQVLGVSSGQIEEHTSELQSREKLV